MIWEEETDSGDPGDGQKEHLPKGVLEVRAAEARRWREQGGGRLQLEAGAQGAPRGAESQGVVGCSPWGC